MRIPPPLFLLSTAILLAGCAGLLTPKQKPVDLYDVTPGEASEVIEISAANAEANAWSLAVEEPLATGGLGGYQIMVRPHPLRLQPLAGARWSERVPAMVQTFLIELFESSGQPRSVGRSGAGVFDYSLETELRAFEAEFFDGATRGTARVRLQARLIVLPDRHIIAIRSFESAVPAEGESREQIVVAFDHALRDIGTRLLRWTLESVAASEAAEPGARDN